MQKDIVTVTNVEAARALRSLDFLGWFVEPTSPTDVAKKAKVEANLVHHHAKRGLRLGLLFEAGRKGGKVFYQLRAKTFKVPRDLLEHEETMGVTLMKLSSAFSRAFERSDRLHSHHDPEFDWFGFDPQYGTPGYPPGDPNKDNAEPCPAHFQADTLRLTPTTYRNLIGKIAALLAETASEPTKDSVICTIGVLGFAGALEEIFPDNTLEMRQISSFVPGTPNLVHSDPVLEPST
jgi:hypothetical protein